MLSSKLQHALIFLNEIKLSDSPISSQFVSEKHKLSLSFIEQICRKLRLANIVMSVRGPGGGYIKGEAFSEVSILEVSTALGNTSTKFISINDTLTSKDLAMREALNAIRL